MTTSAYMILSLPALLTLGAFYSAGELIRRRVRSPGAPAHWLLDDLRPLEDALIDFFASSNTSSRLLAVLAGRWNPIGFNSLAEKVNATTMHRGDAIPPTAVRAALGVLIFARLARMRPNGISITELGREVHRRIFRRRPRVDARPAAEAPARVPVRRLESRNESLQSSRDRTSLPWSQS